MRFRLIGVLAALLMLAPAAGFARTSTLAQQDQTTQTSSLKKKSKVRKTSTKKTAKKVVKRTSKNKKKSTKGQSPAPASN